MSRTRALIPVALIVALLGLRAGMMTSPRDRLVAAPPDPRDPPGTAALVGSLDIARGGPVIVGFQSASPTRFVVGDHELAGRGLVKDRIVLPAGPVAIRLAGDDARLVWSPVGRRGDPEYVPASSLAPNPPERATFDHPGTALLDGAVAAGVFVVVVGSLCLLARRRLRAVPRQTWLAMASVFVAACCVRWIDLSGFGQTWDEDVYWAAGRNYVTNLLSLDFRADSWSWNYEHPPVMKYLAGLGAQFADGFGPARALSAVWVALGCALIVPIGARLYRFRIGVLAAVIAALLPPLVAHGQIVGHESPTVLWWSLGVLLALGVHDAPDRVRIRLAWVGVVIGVAAASRFVNGLLGPLCLAIVVVQAANRRRALREGALIMPATALVTFYALWPRLWLHPIAALGEAFAKLRQVHSVEPFLGALTNHPGPHYFVTYLAATLPLGALVGVVAWAILRARRDRATLIALAWLVIPLAVVASPVRQDGVRYVMPSVVALALLAAVGWDAIATALESRIRHVFIGVTCCVTLYHIVILLRIHPYYLDYFSEQVGGPGTVAAHGWFETAWWGEGVDRAVDYVNDHAAPNARVFRGCIEPAHLAWFRADLWTPMVHSPDQADWIVVYAPQTHRCALPSDAHRVFVVEADGAILAEAWQR